MLLSALTQVLGAFAVLADLDLSPTAVDGVVSGQNEAEERALCDAWSRVCPSLRRVKFPSGTEWIWERVDRSSRMAVASRSGQSSGSWRRVRGPTVVVSPRDRYRMGVR